MAGRLFTAEPPGIPYVCMYTRMYVYTHVYISISIAIHTHTLGYYSVVTKKEILPFETTQMKLKALC